MVLHRIVLLIIVHLQVEAEHGAFTHLGVHPHCAAMCFHKLLHQVQAQARAAILASGAHVHLLKCLKDLLKLVLWDADAGVTHKHVHLIFPLACRANTDLAVVRELAGVANEVVEDLDDAAHVTQHIRDVAGHLHHQLDAPLGQGPGELHHILHDLVQVDLLMLHSQLALAHGRGIQDVVDEVQQARATGFDGGDGFEHLVIHFPAAAYDECVRQANDTIQGRTQLMAHAAHEALLLLNQLLQLVDDFDPVALLYDAHGNETALLDGQEVALQQGRTEHDLAHEIKACPHPLLGDEWDREDVRHKPDGGEREPQAHCESAQDLQAQLPGIILGLLQRSSEHAPQRLYQLLEEEDAHRNGHT
mmetsp:Transcript_10553/g.28877  ORF Transcript_10553/g.28877 Transcript_10553/m.28877 type:complete len:361 (-) Transcript_10553:716-1798(-)